MTQEWVVYGQTQLPASGGCVNPMPGTGAPVLINGEMRGKGLCVNGLVGEQASLPYTVPEGKQLVLEGWGFEGLKDNFGVCIPIVGDIINGAVQNNQCLPSVGCGGGSYYITGTRFVIPAGKKLGVLLLNGTTAAGVVCAWFMQGHLEDVV
jgi:hypothetical protein